MERRKVKPPYQVPSMESIRAMPWNGFNAISTFSGGGGSSTGYRMAGFRVLWASEFIDAARDTYRANMAPHTMLDGRDIRQVKGSDILHAIKMQPGELDLFDGSPPCASFSTAGKRESGWGKVKKYSDKEQRTDDLFFEFVRLIREVKPKTFVAENVSGLVKGTAKGYFLEILKALKESGYKVTCKVLDAKWLGVPQSRQRTIFVGVREDLQVEPSHPKPLPYCYSVRDALPNACEVERETDISRFAIGKEWEAMRTPGTQSKKYFQLQRPILSAPCPTVTFGAGALSCAGVVHPTEKRRFSVAELKRICGFPDDYVLTGTYAQQWERCGRAVPPVMMMHIAAAVRDNILTRLK
jgi:DNA (cytosine-5)-methyltransferase 1